MSDYEEYKEWVRDFERSTGQKVDKDAVEREGHGWEGHEVVRVCTKDGECYYMVESEEEAEAIALERVREDLESEPTLFNQDWLESHLDTDRMLEEMIQDFDDLTDGEMATDWFDEDEIRDALELGEDADVSEVTMADMQGTDIYDQKAKDRAEGVVYNKSDFGAYFPKERLIDYLDIESAAEEAVSVDGWQHFISHYDGDSDQTKKGRVFWRDT
jgi:hypothetical protein